jgi:adenosylcobinamide-GDP ribazoletransferase
LHARADRPVAGGPSGATSGATAAVTVAAGGARRPWHGLAGAIAFLTILPAPTVGEAGLGSAAAWFPVVGAAVGALAGGVRLLCGEAVSASVATVLAMIVLVVVTGALHQDGLADTADGLGVRGDRTRRLEVMRDSSTGVFGALALVGWALLLFTTLSSLDGDRALRALVVACALARWAALAHAAATGPARADGLGGALRVGPVALALATALSVVLALAVGGLVPGAAAIATAVAVAGLSVVFARGTLGGRTGDTLGATVAVTELFVCVVLLAVWVG